MKLIASMNVKNEMSRYLTLVVPHLLRFCDEIRVQDDGSDDGSYEYLEGFDRVAVKRNNGSTWSEHEGQLHQNLLDWTVAGKPTHILAIDADEYVPYGQVLRDILEEDEQFRSFTLRMCEVWSTNPWLIRLDGGWRPHPVAIAYKCDADMSGMGWQMWDRKMAGGRVPRCIRNDQRQNRCRFIGADILHLGWSRPIEREGRYRRYVELDGGNYHASEHLDSIMLPDDQISLEAYPERHAQQLPVLTA